jgi:hypothetical protein
MDLRGPPPGPSVSSGANQERLVAGMRHAGAAGKEVRRPRASSTAKGKRRYGSEAEATRRITKALGGFRGRLCGCWWMPA